MNILCFGRFSDLKPQIHAADIGDVTTLSELTVRLAEKVEGFAALYDADGSKVAVNKQMIGGDVPLKSGDEIAFMSALSGG